MARGLIPRGWLPRKARDGGGPLTAAHRILVMRPRFLGDLVLATPLLRALRTEAPRALITLLVEERFADLFAGGALVDEIVAIAPRDARPVYERVSTRVLVKDLRSRRFDIVLDLFATPRTAFLAFASGAPIRVGAGRHGRELLYTHRPLLPGGRGGSGGRGVSLPAVEFHLGHLAAIAPPGAMERHPAVPRIEITPAEAARATTLLASLGVAPGEAVVGIHPGASWPGKRWTAAGFSALAARAAGEWNARVIVTRGPAEEARARDVALAAGDAGVLLPILRWRELAGVLSRLDLYVANDCGPMHLAAATGTPTVGIFGPSDPAAWFPYPASAGHRVVEAVLPCRPCPGSRCRGRECLAVLEEERVIAVATEAWGASRGRAPRGRAPRDPVPSPAPSTA